MKFILALIAVIGMVLAEDASYEDDLKKLYKAIDLADGTEEKKITKEQFVNYFMAFDESTPPNGVDLEEFQKHLDLSDKLEKALFKEFNNNPDDNVITKDELESDFDEFDTDDNGELSEEEFIEAIVLGMIFQEIDAIENDDEKVTETEFKTYFKKADKGGKAGIELPELIEYLKDYPVVVVEKLFKELNDNADDDDSDDDFITDQELCDNFHAFNANNDDHLTVEEFRNGVSNSEVGQIFAKLDKNGDHKLTAEEIIDVLDHADGKKDGKITRDEVNAIMKGIPEKAVDNLYTKLNNGEATGDIEPKEVEDFVKANDDKEKPDGALNWTEFKAALAA